MGKTIGVYEVALKEMKPQSAEMVKLIRVWEPEYVPLPPAIPATRPADSLPDSEDSAETSPEPDSSEPDETSPAHTINQSKPGRRPVDNATMEYSTLEFLAALPAFFNDYSLFKRYAKKH